MVVEQLWWVQKNMTEPKDQTVWFLPPSFAVCAFFPHKLKLNLHVNKCDNYILNVPCYSISGGCPMWCYPT